MNPAIFNKSNNIDKEKIIEISLELMPIGAEFEKDMKEVLKKYYQEYPAEVSEAMMSILQTLILSISGEQQAIHLMIELLHRQHMMDELKSSIPTKDMEELSKQLDKLKGSKSPEDIKNILDGFLDKRVNKQKDGNKPDYMG